MADPNDSLSISQFDLLVDLVRRLGRTPADPLLVHLPGWTRGQLQRALKRAVRDKKLETSRERGITFYAVPGQQPPAGTAPPADTMLTKAIRDQHPLQGLWSAGQPDQDGDEGDSNTQKGEPDAAG